MMRIRKGWSLERSRREQLDELSSLSKEVTVMDPQIRVGIDVGCKAHRVSLKAQSWKSLTSPTQMLVSGISSAGLSTTNRG